jgi:hypothetical protein
MYRRATGTVGATNVSVTWSGAGYAQISVQQGSNAGINAPVLQAPNGLAASTYWQSPALTVTDRLVLHWALIVAARTQGTLSNQGTITSTNTSRAYSTLATLGFRLEHASSAVTSSAGGAVRGTFSGGTADASTFSIVLPNNPGAAAGTVPVVTTASLTVVKRTPVSGTAAVVTTASGALTARYAVGGSVAVVSAASGAAGLSQSAAGTALVVSTTAGTVASRLAVGGTVPVVSTVSGALASDDAAAGTVTVVSTVTGAATLAQRLAGTVVVVTTVYGSAEHGGVFPPIPTRLTLEADGAELTLDAVPAWLWLAADGDMTLEVAG